MRILSQLEDLNILCNLPAIKSNNGYASISLQLNTSFFNSFSFFFFAPRAI
ncbi:MAG: hypothetical protein P4L22_05625 [Candidatus Babeliales bacterium]|nr:hypothetical protein [Candidatus Babeliales bacterium]